MPKLPIHGTNIHYESTGDGPALLLIHGLGSSTRDWEYQTGYFAERYRVVTLDVRGHGQSGKPPGPYSIPGFAEDTAELIRWLGLAPAHVVGLSMGGMIAFQLAVSAPELLRSLVIVNSGPEFPRSLKARMLIVQRTFTSRVWGMRKLGEHLARGFFPKPEQEDLRRLVADRWAENDPRAYREALKALLGWSVAEHLPAIRCPTLVIASEQDYTPVAVKEAYVARMPHAEVAVIPDARHFVAMEKPEPFNRVLSAFLSKFR